MARVLVDTGPLVALAVPRDPNHFACRHQLGQLPSPLLTCWPVITEAAWLLRTHERSLSALLTNCASGFLEILELGTADIIAIRDLMLQYRDIRPQLADAALVQLARRERINTIFTIDRRDFTIYRDHRDQPFTLIPV